MGNKCVSKLLLTDGSNMSGWSIEWMESFRLTHLEKSGSDKVALHVLPVVTVYEQEYRRGKT